ncbi:MAG: InlB B-repeat-containing protein [Candidatus Binatia bacterium]
MNPLVAAACRIAIASSVLLTIIGWHVEVTAAQLTLTWEETSTNELGFSIERSVGTTGTFAEIATMGPSTITYADLNLADATTYCYRVRAFNAIGYSNYSNAACGTTAQAFGLAVLKTGAGTGTVSSVPAGITCGANCSGTYATGTAVTLTASAASGSTFTGWSGGGCTGTGTCVVTVTATTTVTAHFAPQTVALSVSTTGTGVGTVTSAPAGITCGATCSSTFATGASVTLSASPGASSTFSGWSGGCAGTGSCTVTLTAATSVTATFAIQSVTLTVSKAGTGSGAVTSTPAGINCGTTCSSPFPSGTSVTLSASPTAGSTFSGWSGGGCAGTGTCAVSPSAATTVTATFALQQVNLTVNKTGTGSGTVNSTPSGIACGTTCSWSYPSGTTLTLSASPAAGSVFSGWGGPCSGTGTCTVSLSAATTVTATFNIQAVPSFTLTVGKAGAGSGSVSSTPSGISCGTTCAWSYPSGTPLTLTASPAPGSVFAGWSGGGCSGTGSCVVTLTAATTVTATIDLQSVPLTVNMVGTGSGTVTSTPVGITCGTTCTWSYPSGTPVTLVATPAVGSSFAGWTGGGCTGTGLCITTLAASTSVTATFTLAPPTSFSDNFGRADSTDLGPGWTEPRGDFEIRNRSLRNGTQKTRHLAVQSSLTLSTGVVRAEFTSLNNNAAPAFGLVFGFVDERNYYAAYRQVGGSSLLKIVRVTNGVETVLVQRGCANPVRGWDFDLAVSLSANQIVFSGAGKTLTASGVAVAPGKVGVMVTGGGSSHVVDDFEAAQ